MAAPIIAPLAARALQDQPEAIRVLFPADQTILESGSHEVLCVLAEGQTDPPLLKVDGKPRRWEATAPPMLLARLDLTPGFHTIAIGKLRIRIYVQGDDTPPQKFCDWPTFRSHPGSAEGRKNCADCHEARKRNGRQAVGAFRGAAACQHCHSPGQFELVHFHPERPLAACQECHALHGSPRPSLLRAPAKELCARCHD